MKNKIIRRRRGTALLILGTFLTMLLGGGALNKALAKFNDVPEDHANAEAIQFAQTYKIVGGYADGAFRPENPINRAELLKIVIEAQFGSEEISRCVSKNGKPGWTYMFFRDVPIDAWFAKYICVGKLNGIVGGYPDNTFRQDQNITFAEAAKIIASGFKMEVASDPIWYRPFVKRLEELKAIPTTIGAFDKSLTRGEVAEMIYRLKKGVTAKESLDYATLEAYSQEWNTIRNAKVGFEIKAPKSWNVRLEKLPESVFFYSEELSIADNGCGLFQKSVNQQDLMEWVRSYHQQDPTLPSPEIFTSKTLNGAPSIEANSIFSSEKSFTEIYLLHQNNIYRCRFPDRDPSDSLFENHAGLYKKVASTFKFTSADAPEWKTYQNTRYGYAISTPSDWKINTAFSEKNFTRRGLEGSKTFIGGETSFSKDGKKTLTLSVYKSDPNENFDQFIVIQNIAFVKKTNTRVNRLNGVRLELSNGNTLILVKSGEKMFVFSLSASSAKETAEKIIQSFALGSATDTGPIVDSSGWKTVENGEYGFTVKTPADWVAQETGDTHFEQEMGFGTDPAKRSQARIGALSVDSKTYLDSLEKDLKAKRIKETVDMAIGDQKGSKTTYQDLSTNGTFSVYLLIFDGKTFAIRADQEFEGAFVGSFSIGKIAPAWKTYKNELYGFSLALNEIWKGYQVVNKKPSAGKAALDYYYICVPTQSAQWTDLETGFFCPLSITVVPAEKWEDYRLASEPLVPATLGKNISYVFTYDSTQDAPEDGVAAMGDIKNVLSGFKATSKECTDTPQPTETGRLVFPVAPKYGTLAFLGELFTASDCGPDRLSNIFGIRGDEYILGSTLGLSKSPSQILIDTFKAIGYICADVNVDSACKQWNLEKVVKTESILRLKAFLDYLESNSCVNCG